MGGACLKEQKYETEFPVLTPTNKSMILRANVPVPVAVAVAVAIAIALHTVCSL
jgi:hypothetical protein